MTHLAVSGLTKTFGKARVLDGIDLVVQSGELCVIVGPAGSGKSTLLRTIAGLERSDAGTVAFDGEYVNDLRPRDRNVAMVFQEPTLFPYLTVQGNIAFGPKAQKMPRAEVAERVAHAAEVAGVSHLMGRYPRQLSISERQSVAIAHAIARDALVYLFDEPLAHFDTVQRESMRAALKRLHQERRMTTVYATRDPLEALGLADRIVLIRDGRIEQEGTPAELFERPVSRFVAGFFGVLKMNFLAGVLARSGADMAVKLANGGPTVPLPPGRLPDQAAAGQAVVLGLRPEHMMRAIRVSPPDGTLRYEAEIEILHPTGARLAATFRMGGEPMVAELQAHDVSAVGEKVTIDINLKRAMVFDAETEAVLSPTATRAAPREPAVPREPPPKPAAPPEPAVPPEPVVPTKPAAPSEPPEPPEPSN